MIVPKDVQKLYFFNFQNFFPVCVNYHSVAHSILYTMRKLNMPYFSPMIYHTHILYKTCLPATMLGLAYFIGHFSGFYVHKQLVLYFEREFFLVTIGDV